MVFAYQKYHIICQSVLIICEMIQTQSLDGWARMQKENTNHTVEWTIGQSVPSRTCISSLSEVISGEKRRKEIKECAPAQLITRYKVATQSLH